MEPPVAGVELEQSPCPLGCAADDQPVLTGRDRLHDLPGEFNLVKCRGCGLMRTNPRPSSATIGAYYPDDYAPYAGTRVDRRSPSASGLKRLLKRVINFNTQRIPQLAPGRMLEIGCASGAYLHKMAEYGWQVEGIEFSPQAAAAARDNGYRVHTSSLEGAPELQGDYDLVVGWMVLEHLHDPVAGLQRLYQWAKPGAWLVLSVPNAQALEFRLFSDYWYALQLPTHLYHYTPQTAGKVLGEAGWQLEAVHHQRVLSNLIGSSGYLLKELGLSRFGAYLSKLPQHPGHTHQLLYPLAWLAAAAGQTGRMTLWARKPDA